MLAAQNINLHGSKPMLFSLGATTIVTVLAGSWLQTIPNLINIIVGLYVFLVGTNLLVLLVYSVIISVLGSAKYEVPQEAASDNEFKRKYQIQQLLILVPFAILLAFLIQEIRRLS